MTASILVATPHPAFGELLRSSLEENGKYRVHVALSAREARASSLHGVFQLAILDSALSDEPFIPLCFDLLDQQKGLRLVVVPPENNPNHPALGGLMPHGYLNRPFYLPDLMETVTRLLEERGPNPTPGLNGQAPGRFQAQKAGVLPNAVPAWLAEPQILAQHLEQQLSQTQALAALVGVSDTTPGSGTLHASAGKLSPAAAQEMTSIVFRYWNRSKKADLMRFVRLSSEKQDFLIYATPLASELVLTLIYDTSAPLSQVRPQTKALAQTLAAEPPEGFQTTGPADEQKPDSEPGDIAALEDQLPLSQPGGQNSEEAGNNIPGESLPDTGPLSPIEESDAFLASPVKTDLTPSEPVKSAVQEPETQPLDDPLLFETNSGLDSGANPLYPSAADNPADSEQSENGEEEGHVINLSALLGSIPQPDPGKEPPDPFNSNWITDIPSSNARKPASYNGWQPSNGFDFERAGEPAVESPQEPAASSKETDQAEALPNWMLEPAVQDEAENFSAGAPVSKANIEEINEESFGETDVESSSTETQMVPGNEPSIDPLEDTRPRVLSAISSLNQLEPVSPALSLLNYTCVLVPRLPQHYLTGELADRLSHWVQQLCVAFGWRLEGISVRPEYLQWTLQVAPSVSPGNLVRIIRQRTSINIFSHFANLAEQNPSGDFWATGYLIVSGSQPPSAQLLRDYIVQTRKRQGIGR